MKNKAFYTYSYHPPSTTFLPPPSNLLLPPSTFSLIHLHSTHCPPPSSPFSSSLHQPPRSITLLYQKIFFLGISIVHLFTIISFLNNFFFFFSNLKIPEFFKVKCKLKLEFCQDFIAKTLHAFLSLSD